MAACTGLTAIALVPNVPTLNAPDPPDGAGIDADEQAWRMGVQAEAEAQPLGSALIDAGLRLYSMLDGEWHNVYVEAYNERSSRHRVRCESCTILYRDVPASHDHDHCCPIMLSHHACCFHIFCRFRRHANVAFAARRAMAADLEARRPTAHDGASWGWWLGAAAAEPGRRRGCFEGGGPTLCTGRDRA